MSELTHRRGYCLCNQITHVRAFFEIIDGEIFTFNRDFFFGDALWPLARLHRVDFQQSTSSSSSISPDSEAGDVSTVPFHLCDGKPFKRDNSPTNADFN